MTVGEELAWALGTIDWQQRQIERLEAALREIRGVCTDRHRFVMMGPRGFQIAADIAERALIPPDPHVYPKQLVVMKKEFPE